MQSGIGWIVRKVLEESKTEERLVVGLSTAVKTLAVENEDTVFCILAQAKPGDSATHMQLILLEAYCYENGIYTIKVDDQEKLSSVVGASKTECCVLVQRFKHKENASAKQPKLKLIDLEERLIDHCEDNWDAKPIIRLPDE